MMKNILKNKRGDISITILVMGILAICIVAILSFSISSKSPKSDFTPSGIIEEALIIKEKINLYSSLGFDESEIIQIFDIKYDEKLKIKYVLLENNSVRVRYNLPE
ncbi:hypothetical protein FJZ20_00155 [Candidatus Pacearchaeota archaeon]|nr:hypothetical protein [Candidatus Pacearchaeota archaeon]